MEYIKFNKAGKIIGQGSCQNHLFREQFANLIPEEFGLPSPTNTDEKTQKVTFNGFDDSGWPINPQIINKTPEELEAEKPPEIPPEKRLAHITNEQLQTILDRLAALEEEKLPLEL